MRFPRLFAVLPLLLAATVLRAQDLAATCHATSSYDLTLRTDGLLFDRAQPAPRQVLIHDGTLRTDGIPVRLNAEDQDRLALFERELRALAPQVRKVARNGVDLAVQSVQAEASGLGLDASTQAELGDRLAAHAAEFKQRIDASNSTHDWQGGAFEQYANQVGSDLMPLVAGGLGQQALGAALSGNLDAAAGLGGRAQNLVSQLRPRLERRMQALRPQIQALCPQIRRLQELQDGIRGADGRPLDLLRIDNGA